MKPLALLVALISGFYLPTYAQASFQSIGSGNWSNPATWVLIDGTSTANFPVAGDTVTLTNAYTVTVDSNAQCSNLTIKGGAVLLFNSTSSILTAGNALNVSAASAIDLNLGVLTVTGTMSVGGASTVTVTQGALTVVGVMLLSSPTSPAGTTLLDVEGGAFSCAGGMTITATTVPAGRFAELRIGNSAVNLVGGLATVSANARINFTGTGALTLAGIVNIANPASFIAGSGKVVYLNLPGSAQTVAPLTYYRLVITGLGPSTKNINAAVAVTDTLTLLTDTLQINAPGTLTLAANATIVRTAGILASTPTFTGSVNLLYNDIQTDTTGPELPVAAGVLQNLTISDPAGIQLGAAATVNDTLNLQQGPLMTGTYVLTVTNPAGGASSDPAVTRTNGYVVGAMTRTIGAVEGIRLFPFGTAGFPSNYREFNLNCTSVPTSTGLLTVQHFDTAASSQSGLPLLDGGESIVNIAPMYWQANAGGGLSGGLYTVTLTAEGAPGVSDVSTLRIVNRLSAGNPWTLNGSAGVNTGTTAAPVIVRTGMSGFSQVTFGSDATNTLPVSLLYFSGIATGNNVTLSWATGGKSSVSYFAIEYSQDAMVFTPVRTVMATSYSSTGGPYSLIQEGMPAGVAYYRLKQVNSDSSFTYSSVIEVSVKGTGALKIYPIPAVSSITVETGSQSVIQLFSTSGKYIKSLTHGENDISGLSPGIYFVKSQDGLVKLVKE